MQTSDIFQDGWQDEALARLSAFLEGEAAVLGAWVVGSMATDKHLDRWSDIDLLLIVDDHAFTSFFPASRWIGDLGSILAQSEETDEQGGLSRLFFVDGRAIDISVSPLSAVAGIANWRRRPFHVAPRAVVKCDPAIAAAIESASPAPWEKPTEHELSSHPGRFFHWACCAIRTIAKGDLLIAAHMANELSQMCLVAAMIVRDEAAGTNIHKASDQPLVMDLELPAIAATPDGILEAVNLAASEFGRQMRRLNMDCSNDVAALSRLSGLVYAEISHQIGT